MACYVYTYCYCYIGCDEYVSFLIKHPPRWLLKRLSQTGLPLFISITYNSDMACHKTCTHINKTCMQVDYLLYWRWGSVCWKSSSSSLPFSRLHLTTLLINGGNIITQSAIFAVTRLLCCCSQDKKRSRNLQRVASSTSSDKQHVSSFIKALNCGVQSKFLLP